MKVYTIIAPYNDFNYCFDHFTGLLLKRTKSIGKEPVFCEKVKNALLLNQEPYKLGQTTIMNISKVYNTKKLINYAANITAVTLKSFALGNLFTSCKLPCFANATEAINFYRNCSFKKNQNELCLPRALFAASLSKRFRENGVIFIGVFLPSTSMHAWIIEDGAQADPLDNMWINFKPVAALCYE